MIYADDADHGTPVRKALLEQGHSAMIRDARFFYSFADCERCDALAFVSVSNRAFILSEYRSVQYITRFGDVQVFDVETGKFGEAISIPLIKNDAPPPPPTEKDHLDERLDNLSDDDLRTFARSVTGATIATDTPRADIEALLRLGKGAPAKPVSESPSTLSTLKPAAAAPPAPPVSEPPAAAPSAPDEIDPPPAGDTSAKPAAAPAKAEPKKADAKAPKAKP